MSSASRSHATTTRISSLARRSARPSSCSRELRARGLTLATAESCTGGLVAARLTDVPGSSDVFHGSVVAYANDVKATQLGVPEEVLA